MQKRDQDRILIRSFAHYLYVLFTFLSRRFVLYTFNVFHTDRLFVVFISSSCLHLMNQFYHLVVTIQIDRLVEHNEKWFFDSY